ncbi:MAG: hypothetical protein NVSMB46_06210 [Candidatus Saccharimonadales bacterium]
MSVISLTIFSSISQAVSANTPIKENYKQVAEILNKNVSTSDEVVISTPFTIYPLEYYYHGDAKIYTLPLWDRRSSGAIPGFDSNKLPSEVSSISKNHRYVYLILSYDQGYEKTILDYYTKHFKQISSTNYSHDLNMYVFQVGYNLSKPLSKLAANDKVQPQEAEK